jgi:hypothetical protein
MTDNNGPKRQYHQHGTHALESALEQLGSRDWIDGLGPVGQALRQWRQGLIEDLGGDPSTAQLAMIDMACREYLILEHVDRWMLSNKAIVNKRNRRLFDIVLHRNRLADSLAKKLQALGLEKRGKPSGMDLSDYVREQYGGGEDDAGT